jgi:hypothetical protein
MHYGSDMASINARDELKDTMRARNNLERIKWSPVLSQIDKASINELYNCKS